MSDPSPYRNAWIPQAAADFLAAHRGTLLDVGGGAAPHCRATHIVDILPFSAERLRKNAWGGEERDEGGNLKPEAGREGRRTTSSEPRVPGAGEKALSAECRVPGNAWTEEQYTRLDLCESGKWPFGDKQFSLAISSHCLEDLRDPLPAVREMCRVARSVAIIVPSRLIEQTRGADHPRYCGFYHHPWIVFAEGSRLVFRRKTPVLMLPKCHIVCPYGVRLRPELGSSFLTGESFEPEEQAFWSERDEFDDYSRFVVPFRGRKDLWIPDERATGFRHRLWKWRQRWLGEI